MTNLEKVWTFKKKKKQHTKKPPKTKQKRLALNVKESEHGAIPERVPLAATVLRNVQRRLFLSALPRQTLHEAAGNRRDDDDAHKQGGGHPDDQGDEEQVFNWRGNREASDW